MLCLFGIVVCVVDVGSVVVFEYGVECLFDDVGGDVVEVDEKGDFFYVISFYWSVFLLCSGFSCVLLKGMVDGSVYGLCLSVIVLVLCGRL